MAAESSRSSTSADSYIGSLISLTSKSEIRYEGVLYNINTEESSIGLRNVRSFGTEGRKKDGPQVPPSDKVYEYILFRGSDIKDLQVKSSPPVQSTPPINSDPAIIQSHYPRSASTTASLPSAASSSLADLSSHTTQLGQHGSNFQGGLPLYQHGGNLSSWGPSPSSNANGTAVPMPMYWQGFYGPPNGLTHLHQQSLLRPPPGLSIPPSLPQPLQYSGFNAPLPTGGLSLPSSNLPEFPPPFASATTSQRPSTLPSSMSLMPPVTLDSEILASTIPNKAPISATSTASLGANLLSLPSLTSSSPNINGVPALSNKPKPISATLLPYQSTSQPITSLVGTAGSVQVETPTLAISSPLLAYQSTSQPITTTVGTASLILEAPTPSLVTPGHLLQSGAATVSSTPSQVAHKDVEVVQVLPTPVTELSAPVQTEAQPPILPLPPQSRPQKPNGAPFQTRPSYREKGSGSGFSRSATKFTEDFDFMAMNEKFNKDEVWGHLGKSNKSHSKENEEDANDRDEDDPDVELSKFGVKPLYKKDDFFDSLSCNTLDNESSHGRIRFSEQMKIDTETFGDFSRYRGGRGRWPPRGGRYRGSYYGRGYGYSGRGRGWSASSRP